MGTLIGRDGELARLERLLDERTALLVRGPRGCGVSALLSAGVQRAAARGLPVLRAVGVEAESGFPYATLHQLLRPLRREVGALPGAPGEALRASFGLSDAGTPDAASVAAALVALAGAAGNGFVCVDEWQWVDAESRAALGAFITRGVGVPVLLGGHTAGPAGVEELWVRPLDPVAASAVLGDELPLLVRERILREAAGRPLALRELPAAYAGVGDGELLGSWAPLTPTLEEAFADGLDGLDADCARAVLVAALDDGGRLPDILAAASRLAGRELSADVFAAAVECGFVTIDGDRVAFTHPLTRAAVRRAWSPAAQAAGHAAFAFAVAATDPDRATWHRVVGAPGLDADLAADLEAASWRSRAAGDYERAAAGLRRAANLTPAGPDRSRRLVAAAELAFEIGGIEVGERLLTTIVPEHLDATDHARLLLLRPRADPHALAAAARATNDQDLALRLRWRAATKLQVLGGDGAAIARGDDEPAARGRFVAAGEGVADGDGGVSSRGRSVAAGDGVAAGDEGVSARAESAAAGDEGASARGRFVSTGGEASRGP
ncbi:ATP-binding protein, partial [Solirubrobacter phytolaccae]